MRSSPDTGGFTTVRPRSTESIPNAITSDRRSGSRRDGRDGARYGSSGGIERSRLGALSARNSTSTSGRIVDRERYRGDRVGDRSWSGGYRNDRFRNRYSDNYWFRGGNRYSDHWRYRHSDYWRHHHGYYHHGHFYHFRPYRPRISSFAFGFLSFDSYPYYEYPYYYDPYPVYAGPVYYPSPGYSSVDVYSPTTIVQTPAQPEFGPDAEAYDGYTQQLPAPDAAPPVPAEEVAPVEQAAPTETSPAMSPEQMDELMKQGSDAFGSGDYEKAARLFLQVGMADNENVDAWLAYALARFASGDYAMSADAIRRGVMKYPDVVNSLFDLRDRYGNQDDFQKHFTRLQDFVLASPSSPDGWLVLGFVRHFTGQREPAAETFKTLKERFDSDAQIADIFLNAKTPAQIEAEIREAESRQPQSDQAAPQSTPPANPAPEPVE